MICLCLDDIKSVGIKALDLRQRRNYKKRLSMMFLEWGGARE